MRTAKQSSNLLVEKVVVYQDGAVEVHHVLPCEEQPVAVDQKKRHPG